MVRITRWISISERCAMLYRMDKFKNIDLTPCQHTYIYYLCNHPDGISQDELAKKVYVNKSNVARNIKALEEAGYVKREINIEDKRAYKVFPTNKAFKVLPLIKDAMGIFNEVITDGLSEDEKIKLESLLRIVASNAANYIDENYEE